jgi:hypothetical protein
VWDTIGAQTDNRAKLGTPPERPSIGEWHTNEDGVPVAGPKPETRKSASPDAKTDQAPGPAKIRRSPDGKGSTENR